MSIRGRQKWLGIRESRDLIDLLTSKARMILPNDAEIVAVRSNHFFDVVEFLVRSKEYPKLEPNCEIPCEHAKVISI